MSKAPNARAVILTAGVAATAVTGAWYGAGLKTKKEIKQVRILLHPRSFQPLYCHSSLCYCKDLWLTKIFRCRRSKLGQKPRRRTRLRIWNRQDPGLCRRRWGWSIRFLNWRQGWPGREVQRSMMELKGEGSEASIAVIMTEVTRSMWMLRRTQLASPGTARVNGIFLTLWSFYQSPV